MWENEPKSCGRTRKSRPWPRRPGNRSAAPPARSAAEEPVQTTRRDRCALRPRGPSLQSASGGPRSPRQVAATVARSLPRPAPKHGRPIRPAPTAAAPRAGRARDRRRPAARRRPGAHAERAASSRWTCRPGAGRAARGRRQRRARFRRPGGSRAVSRWHPAAAGGGLLPPSLALSTTDWSAGSGNRSTLGAYISNRFLIYAMYLRISSRALARRALLFAASSMARCDPGLDFRN